MRPFLSLIFMAALLAACGSDEAARVGDGAGGSGGSGTGGIGGGGSGGVGGSGGSGGAIFEKVEVEPAEVRLVAGESVKLTAIPHFPDGTLSGRSDFDWSSSDEALATVDSTGLVQALGAGAVTITAEIEGVKGQAVITIVPFYTVDVSPTELEVPVGGSYALMVGTFDEEDEPIEVEGAISWSSEDESIGVVDAEGVYRAVTPGVVRVTATVGDVSGSTYVASVLRFEELAVGASHVCGLDRFGATWCWGEGANGQLGLGEGVSLATRPTLLEAPVFSRIAAGETHVCGLTAEGEVFCWGGNDAGQLGAGSGAASWNPQAVTFSEPDTFTRIAALADRSCALSEAGVIWCWGAGVGSPAEVESRYRFRALALGGRHTCAVGNSATATLYCWGDNSRAQVQFPPTEDPIDEPVEIGPIVEGAFAVGGNHSCAKSTTAPLECWGAGDVGQLGDGSTSPASAKVVVMGADPLHTPAFDRVAASATQTCGIAGLDTFCWGDNSGGGLGIGDLGRSEPVLVPTRVPSGAGFAKLWPGPALSCAIDQEKLTHCWGANPSQRLGLGEAGAEVLVPALVLDQRFVFPQATP